MIPFHTKTAEFADPADDSLYYLLASNGVFLVKKTPLYTSITEAKTVAALESQTQSLKLRIPRVPRFAMEHIYGFFREVYERWDAEAVVLLYYIPETAKFRLGVPPQKIYRYRRGGRWRTEGRVEYGHLARPDGHILIGDVHSHCDLPAFFSYTDDKDDTADGLRIILGRVDRDEPDVAASFMASGARFKLDPEQACEDFSIPRVAPRSWFNQITCLYEDEQKEKERWRNYQNRDWHGPNGRST